MDEWFEKAVINYLFYKHHMDVDVAIDFFNENRAHFLFLYEQFEDNITKCLLENTKEPD